LRKKRPLIGEPPYSSIYVAASTVLLGVSKEDLMIPIKEGADQESLTP
jgi:preprotein translocase subunit SecF